MFKSAALAKEIRITTVKQAVYSLNECLSCIGGLVNSFGVTEMRNVLERTSECCSYLAIDESVS